MSENTEGGEINSELENLIKKKEKERDGFINSSFEKLSKLKEDLRYDRIDHAAYEKEHQEIKRKIEELNAEISGLGLKAGIKSKDSEKDEKEATQKPDITSYLPSSPYFYLIFMIFAFSAIIYLLSNYYECVPVNISSKMFDIFSLLSLIEKGSKQDYRMICSYVDGIDYVTGYGSYAEGAGGNIRLSSNYVLGNYPGVSDEEKASVIVHEACHVMMWKIMGGRYPMTEQEVERPCVRMQYMYMYRAGFFDTYEDMLSALSKEEYGRDRLLYTSGIPQVLRQYRDDKIYKYSGNVEPYCSKSDIEVKKVKLKDNFYDIQITNTGTTIIHCGFLGLTADGLEYPLNCAEIYPGQSYTTGVNFHLENGQEVSIEITGCGKKTGV